MINVRILLVLNNPKDRKGSGRRFKFGEGGIFVYWNMGSRSWRPLEVGFQDGRSFVNWYLFELNRRAPTTPNKCPSVCGTDILYSLRLLTEHGHQVTLPVQGRQRDR